MNSLSMAEVKSPLTVAQKERIRKKKTTKICVNREINCFTWTSKNIIETSLSWLGGRGQMFKETKILPWCKSVITWWKVVLFLSVVILKKKKKKKKKSRNVFLFSLWAEEKEDQFLIILDFHLTCHQI